MTTYTQSKIRSIFPFLRSKSEIPINTEDMILHNREIAPAEMLGITIYNSQGGHAKFGNPNSRKGEFYAVEVHQNTSSLFPFPYTDGEKVLTAPALFNLVKTQRLTDFMVISTAHVPKTDFMEDNIRNQKKTVNNEYQASLLNSMMENAMPLSQEITRNLYIIGDYKHIAPLPSGQLRGLGGNVVRFTQSGPMLYNLIRRMGTNFKDVHTSEEEDVSNEFHLNIAAPSRFIENDTYLEIDGVPFGFFVGGVIDSDTYPKIAQMDVDIFLRLEFILNTSDLFVTSLLRTSGSIEKINNIYDNLKNIGGGWKIVSNNGLIKAFKHTIPGSRFLPPSYTRYLVKNWFRTSSDNNGWKVGLLQKISEGIGPIGNPQGDMTFGKKYGRPWMYDSADLASVLVTGPSRKTGKSTTTAYLATLKSKDLFWIDMQASDKDAFMNIAHKSNGEVKLMYLPDPEFNYDEIEKNRLSVWSDIKKENKEIVRNWLNRMEEDSNTRGRIANLPFVLHPVVNSTRYIDLVKTFLETLPYFTKLWLKKGWKSPQLVINDFSQLLTTWGSADKFEKNLSYQTANQIVWYISHGYHNGISPTWVTTHAKTDFSAILGHEVYSKFGLHLDGGLEASPDYHYNLMVPSSGIIEVEDLDCRIYNRYLLNELRWLDTETSNHLLKNLKFSAEDIRSIETRMTYDNTEGEGYDGQSYPQT